MTAEKTMKQGIYMHAWPSFMCSNDWGKRTRGNPYRKKKWWSPVEAARSATEAADSKILDNSSGGRLKLGCGGRNSHQQRERNDRAAGRRKTEQGFAAASRCWCSPETRRRWRRNQRAALRCCFFPRARREDACRRIWWLAGAGTIVRREENIRSV